MKKSKEHREFNIKEVLGDGVNIKETKKSKIKKDRNFFTNLVSSLVEIDGRTELLMGLGVDLIAYEDPYHNIIEGMIFKHYGQIKGEIITWWLTEKRNPTDKNIVLQGVEGIDYPMNTAIQLYNALERVEKLMERDA